MTPEEFSAGIEELEGAFNQSLAEKSSKVYFKHLCHLENEAWLSIIEAIIKTQDRFPTIHTILGSEDEFDAAVRRYRALQGNS